MQKETTGTGNRPAGADRDATRESFLDRLRRMDPDSWEELYRRYRMMVVTRAVGAGIDPVEAEDVVQMVFASVARHPPGPSPRRGAFRAWLREQTRWRIADKLRELDRRPGAGVWDGTGEGVEAGQEDGFALQWDMEFARHVREVAMQRLAMEISAEHFQVFQLTGEQGWPVRKVAQHFRLAAPTVYVIRHRVAARLKALMAVLVRESEEALGGAGG